MATKKGPMEFTHWKRPVNRMYEYNHQFAENYYKPQVKYIEGPSSVDWKVRRGATEPPGAQSFIERWVAYPFYGRTEPISELRAKGFIRAGSVPDLSASWEAAEIIAQQEQDARVRSASRGRSVSRELSVFHEEANNRASRAQSEFNVSRASRSRSRSYFGHVDNYVDEYAEREIEDILRHLTDPNVRERSISVLRDELDNPRVWKGKQKMQTTLRHGYYKNTLYGTETWDPSPYVTSRGGRN